MFTYIRQKSCQLLDLQNFPRMKWTHACAHTNTRYSELLLDFRLSNPFNLRRKKSILQTMPCQSNLLPNNLPWLFGNLRNCNSKFFNIYEFFITLFFKLFQVLAPCFIHLLFLSLSLTILKYSELICLFLFSKIQKEVQIIHMNCD